MRTLLAPTVAALTIVTAAGAVEHGTPEEAQAMLQRAVDAIMADEPAALAAFTAGAPGFKDKDLYVFCAGEDGKVTAHGSRATILGQNLRAWRDKGGRPFGEEIYAVAVEGAINTVEYSQARPGEVRPSWKVAYVTRVADQVCGVGYYK